MKEPRSAEKEPRSAVMVQTAAEKEIEPRSAEKVPTAVEKEPG